MNVIAGQLADPLVDDKPLTMEEAAALDFMPEPELASLDVAAVAWNPHGIILQAAAQACAKTKPELVAAAGRDMDTTKRIIEGCVETREFFEAAIQILQAAEARMMCAAAVVVCGEQASAA